MTTEYWDLSPVPLPNLQSDRTGANPALSIPNSIGVWLGISLLDE
jgi:hypothetical protein